MKKLLLLACTVGYFTGISQEETKDNEFVVHGNTQINIQQYSEDTLIGATAPKEQTAMNAFTNVIVTKGAFSAGIRYESYLNAQLGYPERFKGTGLGYRTIRFSQDIIDITVGNFYEQFGNGLIFRSYEDRLLGVDNAMDGVRLLVHPYDGVRLKMIYGKQRYEFNEGLINGGSLVRGIDAEVNFNELIDSLVDSKFRLIMGISGVSKYQPDDRTDLILPENVAAVSGRIDLGYNKISMMGEYAYKFNDPSNDNGFIYKEGKAVLINITYSTKGFYISGDTKFVDNMSFRSDRNAFLTDLNINYLPALTKTHTYNLAATLYPYSTQPTGEMAYQGEIGYKFPKKKKTENKFLGAVGGKYGTSITANYAVSYGLDSTNIVGTDSARMGYTAPYFIPGNEKYFSDFNVTITKKWSNKFSTEYMHLNIIYNNEINQGAYDNQGQAYHGTIYADINILEFSYNFMSKQSIRTELQHLSTKQHQKNWATIILEYTYSPHWFIGVLDQYNYGNDNLDERIHYLYGTMGFIVNSTRISMGYGKQKAGLFCVGGVCRPVPASNGLTFTVTSSF